MNEEYVKQLMDERKGESPFKLWFELMAYQLLFGLIFIATLFVVFGAIEWLS